MAFLSEDNVLERAQQRAVFRLTNVSSKLNRAEAARLDALVKRRGLQRGELIRQLILDELARDAGQMPASDPALAEILGVRLLLVNVLRPLAAGQAVAPETFDQMLDQIGQAKHQLAQKMLAEREGK